MTDWGARPAGEDPGVVDAASEDPEVDQLVEEIEITRVEMTGTVSEIGERLDPKNIVAGAKATVRDATVGRVEEMASNVGQTAQEAGSGIVETIKRNPVPAAMAAIGIGWLAMSARSSSSGSRSGYGGYGYGGYGYGGAGGYGGSGYGATGYGPRSGQPGAWETERMGAYGTSSGPNPVEQAGQKAGDVVSQAGQKASDAVSSVQQSAGEAVSQVQDRAGRLAEDVGRTAGQVPQQVGYTTREVTDRVGYMIQSNPLGAGAIALAVGTAVGLALPVTSVERKVMTGPAGEALHKAETVAADALGQAEQKAREVEQQAREEDQSSMR